MKFLHSEWSLGWCEYMYIEMCENDEPLLIFRVGGREGVVL
jgi:hypothetical protein